MNASLSLGEIYLNLNKTKESIKYLSINDSIAKIKNDLYALRNSYEIKYLLYKKLGDYKNALENSLNYERLNDSISSIENHKGLEQQELIAEFEKIESKSREEQQIKDNRIREEKKIQNLIIVFVACGFLLVAVLLVIVFRNYRNKQRSNLELAQKNELISTQKKVVEEKQKEMLDSITYAKRLQSAILPPDNFIRPHFDDFFIFYKPKDIVAGDFYWAEQSDNLVFIAAADSTGHGVPGAMVSVVCSNALNRTIKEFKLSETGKILDRARDLVIETFEKSNSDVKDGMDISLLCVDNLNNKIFWSGANNPLWYFQNGKLNEITADKQPIGKTENKKPFSTHEIAYQKGSIFYLFTDGYADQFGGPKGKKFKYKQLQDLLLRNIQFAMAKQQSELDSEFVGWKGELEQIDDVCVIGLKI